MWMEINIWVVSQWQWQTRPSWAAEPIRHQSAWPRRPLAAESPDLVPSATDGLSQCRFLQKAAKSVHATLSALCKTISQMCYTVGLSLFFDAQILHTACNRGPRQWRVQVTWCAVLLRLLFGLQSTLIKVIDCVGAVERLRKSHHVHVSAKCPHQQFCLRSCFEAT